MNKTTRRTTTYKLFVEGGGDSNDLRTQCRAGFTSFINKAGIQRKPRVVACGSRRNAYDSYCTALANGEEAMLLVDSEDPVAPHHHFLPWAHLHQRDQWVMPNGGKDDDCHLMVQVMETWFLADRTTLTNFFGQHFNSQPLPAIHNPIEGYSKAYVYSTLRQATQNCQKGPYGKGAHSFALLTNIAPQKICQSSPWADRFIAELAKR